MKQFVCLLLLLSILCIFTGCQESPEIITFQMDPSKRGVEDLPDMLGYISPMHDFENFYNITPKDIEDTFGFAIYKDNTTCVSYLVYGDDCYLLSEWFGGYGPVSFAVADLNADTFPELYFTYSWGSGHHRSHVGYFDSSTGKTITFTQETPNEDMVLVNRGGLMLYTAKIGFSSFVDMELTKSEKIGEILCINNDIQYVLKDGTYSPNGVYSNDTYTGSHQNIADFQTITVGESTWEDVLAIASVPYLVDNSLEIILDNGNTLLIIFDSSDHTVRSITEITPFGIPVSPEKASLQELSHSVYSRESLQKIVDFGGTLAEYSKAYPILCLRNTPQGYRIAYPGENTVAVLDFDREGNLFWGSRVYETVHSLAEFTVLEVGTTLEQIEEMDPGGDYRLFYTSIAISDRASCHYTSDGYYVTILYEYYDENMRVKEIIYGFI